MSWVILALILLVSYRGSCSGFQATAKKDPITGNRLRVGKRSIWVSLIAQIVAIIPSGLPGLRSTISIRTIRFICGLFAGFLFIFVGDPGIVEARKFKNSHNSCWFCLVAFGVGFQLYARGLHFRTSGNSKTRFTGNWIGVCLRSNPAQRSWAWSFPNRDYYSQNALAAQLELDLLRIVSQQIDKSPINLSFWGAIPCRNSKVLCQSKIFTIDFRTYEFKENTSKIACWFLMMRRVAFVSSIPN